MTAGRGGSGAKGGWRRVGEVVPGNGADSQRESEKEKEREDKIREENFRKEKLIRIKM